MNTGKTDLNLLAPVTSHHPDEVKAIAKTVYQCRHCFTVYDETIGSVEDFNAINPSFEDLPGTYKCPLCEAGKEDFIVVDKAPLQLDAS